MRSLITLHPIKNKINKKCKNYTKIRIPVTKSILTYLNANQLLNTSHII